MILDTIFLIYVVEVDELVPRAGQGEGHLVRSCLGVCSDILAQEEDRSGPATQCSLPLRPSGM